MFQKLFRGDTNKSNGGEKTGAPPPFQIVMSVPHEHRNRLLPRVPGVRLTYDVLGELFGQATKGLRVFSPFIDASFTSLALSTRVPIRVLTTVRHRKQKSVSVIERAAMTQEVDVRYIHQQKADSHLYQLHAKMVLADESFGYVGSANLTDASIHYNYELGFLVRDRDTVRNLIRTFDYLYDEAGFAPKIS